MLRESSAPLVGHEERTDATNQADDSDGSEHGGAYELETSETCHDQEDDARDEEPEANKIDSHSLLRLGRAARRNVPQLGGLDEVRAGRSEAASGGRASSGATIPSDDRSHSSAFTAAPATT